MRLKRRRQEKKTIGYLSDKLEYTLDKETWATIEKLTTKHDSKDIGFMVYIGPRPTDSIQEPDYDFEFGVNGLLIEGTRIRFMGDKQGVIEKLSYAEFIRRIPSREELKIRVMNLGIFNKLSSGLCYASYLRAYQVVREDEKGFYICLNDKYDKKTDALEVGSYHASTTRFSNGVLLQGNMPPVYGKGGIEPYSGVMYGSGIYGLRDYLPSKEKDMLNHLLSQIETEEVAQKFLAQSGLQEILRRMHALVGTGVVKR